MSRVALVADLHLGAGPWSEWRAAAAAFAEFAGDYLPESRIEELVILGDFLELLSVERSPQVGIQDARTACDRLLDAAPDVTDGLGRFLAAGGNVTVVVGNHDAHLADPGVAARLLNRLCPPGPGEPPVNIAPWFHRIPGVLYAEHGHQHHDINRVAVAVEPFDPSEPDYLQTTPAVALQSARAAHRPILEQFQNAYVAARSIRADSRHRGERESADIVGAYGAARGIPPEATRQLANVSAFSTRHSIQRTVRRRLFGSSDSYLTEAAVAIDQLLRSRGLGEPIYAFGHTHRARIRWLPSGARYVNPGAWSPMVRKTGPSQRHPFALIDCPSPHDDATDVRVFAWLHDWSGLAGS